jgi:hypothetical protein
VIACAVWYLAAFSIRIPPRRDFHDLGVFAFSGRLSRERIAKHSGQITNSRKEVMEVKEALALIVAVCVLAYVCAQMLLAALQPLLVTLSGHAR